MEEIDYTELTDDQLVKLGLQYSNSMLRAKEIADNIREEIRNRHAGELNILSSDGTVEADISYPRTFDETKAKELLSEEELTWVSVRKVDPKLVKRHYSDEEYELMLKDGTPRVSFKLRRS